MTETGSKLESVNEQPVRVAPYHRYKCYVDPILAAIMVVPATPIILIAALLTKLTSKGPAFYTQIRVGRDGRLFSIYKIRTMVQDAESGTGAVWASHGDPRVTVLGKILRKLHIDELPQLWNVLRGEMVLVGPRPERPEFVEVLDHKIKGYKLRLLVQPGVTGYAQLNLPSDKQVDDVRRKLSLDLEYIEQASVWFDFLLIFGTCFRFIKFTNKTPLRLLGIAREPEESGWAEYFKVPIDRESTETGAIRLDAIFLQEKMEQEDAAREE